jgi:hypothetical protein
MLSVVTPRRIIVEICNRPGIAVGDLSRLLDQLPAPRTLDALKMLARNGVVEITPAADDESTRVTSLYPHFEIAVQVAMNAGIEVDKPVSRA